MIAKEALMQLKNNLVMANKVHREYKKEFTGGQGSSVSIRRPVKFNVTNGATAVIQDTEEKTTNITIDQRKHVAWDFTTQDLTLSIEEYSERYIKPAVIALANDVDISLTSLYSSVFNQVGTIGTTPANYAAVAAGAQRLDEMAVDSSNRCMVLNPAARYAISGNQMVLEGAGAVKKTAYEESLMGRVATFDTYATQNIATHQVGPFGGTPLINGGAQNVTYLAAVGNTWSQSLITDGWTAAAAARVRAGDIFTIAGVFAVNPVPRTGAKQVMPYLQQFTCIANGSSDAAGNLTMQISPPIITSGPQQTVSAVPADNAAMTFVGTAGTLYPVNLGFHKNAFALVTVPLEMPDGAAFKARETYDGLSMRVIKDYDFTTDTDRIRLDILYGVKAIYPDLAVRLAG
jgi:hypothetical protein